MKRQLLLAVAVLVPAFAVTQSACKKDESVASSGSASASVAASASGASSLTALTSAAATDTAAAPTADPDKLPPPAAAATQAAQSVSTANYKTELDTIEKEINGIK